MPRIIPAQRLPKAQLRSAEVIDAERKANTIVQTAQAKAQQIEKLARLQGLEQGRQQIAEQLLQAQTIRSQALAAAEKELVDLAVIAAKRIVREELTLQPDHIHATVNEVLGKARASSGLKIYLHPDDAALVSATLSEKLRKLGIEGCVEIVDDAELTRGGCVLQSRAGEIDARIEIQFKALEKLLSH